MSSLVHYLDMVEDDCNDPIDTEEELVTKESSTEDVIIAFHHNAVLGAKMLREAKKRFEKRKDARKPLCEFHEADDTYRGPLSYCPECGQARI